MATAANAYLEQFGPVGGTMGRNGVQDIVWDFTVKPVAAGDALNLFLVPAGTRFQGYMIRNDKNPTASDAAAHTTVSLGLTGATTGLASAAQPSATVNACVIGTTEVSTGTVGKYLVATFATAQTTGKLTIQIATKVMTPYVFA